MGSTDHAQEAELSYKHFGQNLDVKDNSQNLLQRLTDKIGDTHQHHAKHLAPTIWIIHSKDESTAGEAESKNGEYNTLPWSRGVRLGSKDGEAGDFLELLRARRMERAIASARRFSLALTRPMTVANSSVKRFVALPGSTFLQRLRESWSSSERSLHSLQI